MKDKLFLNAIRYKSLSCYDSVKKRIIPYGNTSSYDAYTYKHIRRFKMSQIFTISLIINIIIEHYYSKLSQKLCDHKPHLFL